MKDSILILYMPDAFQRMLPFPPLGMSSLAGYLKDNGIKVRIDDLEMKYWDTNILRFNALKGFMGSLPNRINNPKRVFKSQGKVKSYLYDNLDSPGMNRVLKDWEKLLGNEFMNFSYVGFSIMGFGQLSTSLCFAKYLKEKYGLKIILGGVFLTRRMVDLLKSFGFIDFIIIQEAETALKDLLSHKELSSIPNIIYRRDKKAVINNVENIYCDDSLPYMHDLPLGLYRREGILLIPYELSKGCRNKCFFCVTRRKRLHFKKIETVINHLTSIKDIYKTENFVFVDNGINVDKNFSIELCNAIINRNLVIRWSAYFIPEKVGSDYFELLHKAGCIQLRWGVETLSKTALQEMNKSNDPQTLSVLLNDSSRAGLLNHLIFMVGHPGERLVDLLALIRFIFNNRRYFCSASLKIFHIEPVDFFGENEYLSRDKQILSRINEKDYFGIKIKSYKDRLAVVKYYLIKLSLAIAGIKSLENCSVNKKTSLNTVLFRAFKLSNIKSGV